MYLGELFLAFFFALCWTAFPVFAGVIAVEAAIVKRLALTSCSRALDESLLMNSVSPVLLLLPALVSAVVVFRPYMTAVLNRNHVTIALVIIGPLFIALIVSILVEAAILARRTTAALREALRVSAVANLTSYFLATLVMTFLLPV